MTDTKKKFRALRPLCRVSIGGTNGGSVGVYSWIVLDKHGHATKQVARQSEIDFWYTQNGGQRKNVIR